MAHHLVTGFRAIVIEPPMALADQWRGAFRVPRALPISSRRLVSDNIGAADSSRGIFDSTLQGSIPPAQSKAAFC
jgi:hypothetical protein